ncbi:DUF1501 domain-containing protein [Singulisphaera acidiphila]|uniref:Arylsulfatase A family protein n=1 Tax=Singulisphaera acidiphila (strain ATCC BAA-1392 / DSM 18658 / VKM B-2454 / MOB10) TaxID=886293 RepID=L0DAJ9_SINAD|nr:DUF1501 domain-containing protein [Singulisphaera acidiphila]AGA25701.1 hypothetical protein Sinac_1314 [Singulisphaera acidiphila DSM 18658]
MPAHYFGNEVGTLTRREALRRAGTGFGALALSALFAEEGLLAPSARAAESLTPLAPRAPQFAPKAKRVIHLFMNGGPSHVDTFDPKPALTKQAGKALPSLLPTERKTGAAFASPFKFRKYGQSGIEVSDLFAQTAECIDDICVIRSMHADVPNHEPSLMLMNCGDARQARPSVGSWVLYGLGSENQNLPGYLVMCPGGYPIAESQNWQAAFLPGVFQGTYIDSQHTDIEKLIRHIKNRHVSHHAQHAQLELLQELNREHMERRQREADLEARIQSFELAFRMQTEAGDAFDVSQEPESIRKMYGPGVQARQTLIARRLLERGVRYVQLWHGEGQPWDSHDDIAVLHANLAKQCDQPIAALLKDLKQRGMLDDTLVIWGGEFGRTPTVELPTAGANQGKMNGRDHNHYGFTMWMAGGGVKGGHVHGATDEFGFQAVENKVHVHDLHATILRLLGFDHETFTYRYAGRDFRLTDVHGKVINDIIA